MELAKKAATISARVDQAIEEYLKPIPLPKASGSWLNCREARELVWAISGERSPWIAERALARRAFMIPSKVASWSYAWEPQDGLSRLDLALEDQDTSDWTPTPSRRATLRRWETLGHIGDDPSDYLLNGSGLRDACWISGDFTVVIDGDFRRETVGLIGLAFDPDAIRETLGSSGCFSGPEGLDDQGPFPAAKAVTGAGGRPAAKHGEVIAAVTLRLAALDPRVMRTYTAEALATELEADYASFGETPPGYRSRLLHASGILRVLRARLS